MYVGKKLTFVSPKQIVTVYGPVGFATWCSNESGCQLVNGGGGPITVGGNIDNFVDWVCGSTGDGFCGDNNANYFPQGYTLDHRTSCRSFTWQTVALAQDNGNSGGTISVTVTQHTLNQQVANLSAVGQVTPMTFNLDGGPVVINMTNTGPLSFYLIGATADCYTSTGTP